MKRTLAVFALALAAAPSALAKGAEISGSPPSDPDAGERWTASVRLDPPDLARHVDVAPAVVLRSADGDTRMFRAEPTKAQGVYEATVTFPAAGRWSYAATMAPHVVPPESASCPWTSGRCRTAARCRACPLPWAPPRSPSCSPRSSPSGAVACPFPRARSAGAARRLRRLPARPIPREGENRVARSAE